jgi:hypothetical protein
MTMTAGDGSDGTKAVTTRRAVLGAALASGAAAAVGTLARPLSAVAATGDPVLAGKTTEADALTTLSSTESGLYVTTTGYSGGTVIEGYALGVGIGVLGHTASGTGVLGVGNIGLRGETFDFTGTGVQGVATTLDGENFGVYGATGSPIGVGVYGQANSGTGMKAVTISGTALHASATSGTALRVDGKVHLSRSGRATIAKGAASKVVVVAGVTTSSKVFAVLAASRTGRYVRAVVPSSGYFTIRLNDKVSSKTSVSWFVLD